MKTILLSLLLLPACAAGPAVFVQRPESPLVWPGGDQPVRISMEFSYRGLVDTDRDPGFWSQVGQWVIGQEDRALAAPYGMVTSADGETLFVADPGRGVVHRISLYSGEHRYLTGLEDKPFRSPVGVTSLPSGDLVVSDSTRENLVRCDSDGEAVGLFASSVDLGRPTGLVWDAVGQRLLVLDTTGGRLLAFSAEGDLLQIAGGVGEEAGLYNHPTNLAIASDGRIFLTDSLNFRVQVLNANLEPIGEFGIAGTGPGSFAKPKGIALDSEDHVYVVDGMFDNIQVFDPEGQLLLVFGRSGNGFGEFLLPTGIFIDKQDRIFVADSGNSRFQVFQYHPIEP